MIELLQKDYRLYRGARIVTMIALFLMILLPALAAISNNLSGSPRNFFRFLLDPNIVGQLIAILPAAIFGGCAFAIERRDRSADFLAMLPISRWRIVASKMILAGIVLPVLWIVDSATLFYVPVPMNYFVTVIGIYACAFQLSFGVAWLASVLTRSPSISASLGIAAVLADYILAMQMRELGYSDPFIECVIVIGAASIGVASFIAGTIIFILRVSP